MTDPLPGIGEELAAVLRAEARGMAEVMRDVLLAEAPADSISGVYLKGSSVRRWDSRVDYAPEVSDVDVHVRVRRAGRVVTDSFGFALRIARETERLFRVRFPEPSHVPRPQLFFLEDIEGLDGYLPSTAGSVTVLHGEEYRAGTPKEYGDCPADDLKRFRLDAAFVEGELAGKIIDRPGRLAWQAVSSLTWRVAPTGPRLLTAMGEDPYEVWSMNRTTLVRSLQEVGAPDVAEAYADFYLAAWDGYLTRFLDAAHGLRAIEAVHRLFAEGARIVDESCRTAEQPGLT